MWRLLPKNTRAMSSRCEVDLRLRSFSARLKAPKRSSWTRWLTVIAPPRASRARRAARLAFDHGAQRGRQEHAPEIPTGERAPQHLEPFDGREPAVEQDHVAIVHAA